MPTLVGGEGSQILTIFNMNSSTSILVKFCNQSPQYVWWVLMTTQRDHKFNILYEDQEPNHTAIDGRKLMTPLHYNVLCIPNI